MIFLTVGTDHHQFSRLLKTVDHFARDRTINPDEVLVQYGLNRYRFRYVRNCVDFLTFEEMLSNIERSEITITHASTTAMLAILKGKVPIVIPRDPHYREIIDSHQLEFADRLKSELPMLVVRDVVDLNDVVVNYRDYSESVRCRAEESRSNIHEAVRELGRLTDRWF